MHWAIRFGILTALTYVVFAVYKAYGLMPTLGQLVAIVIWSGLWSTLDMLLRDHWKND